MKSELQTELRQGWKLIRLGDFIELSNGKGITKKQMLTNGDYPVYGSSSILGTADHPLIEEQTICIGRVGACGALQMTNGPCWISDNAMYVSKRHLLIHIDWLFYLLGTLNLPSYAGRTSQPSLPQGPILNQEIFLPPIAVQERIVTILQKADDIRRKRREALKISEAMPVALFYEMFGDPSKGANKWPIKSLDDCIIETRYGTSEKTDTYGIGDPVLRIPNVMGDSINTKDLKYLKLPDKEREKLLLKAGDLLLVRTNGNKDYVGRCAVFDLDDEYIFASYLIRVRVNQEMLLPQFLAAFLNTSFGRTQIDKNTKTSAGQYNLSAQGIRSIKIPLPPVENQRIFINRVAQLKGGALAKISRALAEAEIQFSALLQKAFTGELTAAWEATHAEEIAAYQRLHEQLPALLLLAFIQAKAEQTAPRDAMLITALMKYAFLAQMEGEARRRLFHFVPYHYGPFSKEVYEGLEELQRRGMVTVEERPGEGKTRITLTDPALATAALAALPEDLRQDVQAVIEQYGALDHNDLLKVVYEKYPVYARKSLLKKKKS